ncbi:MAG TPA: TMEM165/GDT1 family protein [Candidatus Cybelea sp.]|nr:TMEM165/GDT1 family protein [Candidatus Cybelea sp.]
MGTFLTALGVVALGEIGDKTQLMALVLAARFRAPLPLIAGMVIATVANHTLAAYAGTWIRGVVSPDIFRWAIGLSFIGLGLWSLKADSAGNSFSGLDRFGAFAASLVSFFLAEFGDKTQIATLALAARFDSILPVIAGSTLGMTLVDAVTIVFTSSLAHRMPVRALRLAAAAVFTILGVLALTGANIEF